MAAQSDVPIQPVLKWVGGKRRLLGEILSRFPKEFTMYYEPFFGGGAVLFALRPGCAAISDVNEDLVLVYQVIRDDVESLIKSLGKHENTPEYFYAIRGLDRDQDLYGSMSAVERASRFLYLNKTCFNGLYRVNSRGEFNAPFGRYKNPDIVNAAGLRAVSTYLNASGIKIYSMDFEEALCQVPPGGFVYLDPPYDPVSDTSSFTSYSQGGFGRSEQARLKECLDGLDRRGVKFLLSNSATEFIQGLYGGGEVPCGYRVCPALYQLRWQQAGRGAGSFDLEL